MPSPKTIAAVRVARSLKPAEVAMNEATLRMLAASTAVLTARTDGTFHPLEAQEAVNMLGTATTKMFEAMREFACAHGSLKQTAIRHDVLGQGDIFESPPHDEPHGDATVTAPARVIPLVAAA